MSEIENSTPEAPPAHSAFSGPPAAGDDSAVKITAAEFNRFKGLEAQLAELQAQHAKDLEAKGGELTAAQAQAEEARKALEAAQAAGVDVEAVLSEHRTAWEGQIAQATQGYHAMRDLYLAREASAAASEALAGHEWTGATPEAKAKIAATARRGLEGLIEAVEEGGKVMVRGKDGRSVAEVVKSYTSDPVFACYVSSRHRGGSGTDATRQAAPPHPMDAMSPGNPHPPGSVAWWGWRHRENQPPPTVKVRPRSAH